MPELNIKMAPDIRWWGKDDPGDQCSWCMELVPENEHPLLLFRGEGEEMEIARFHNACAEPALGMKIEMAPHEDDDDGDDW